MATENSRARIAFDELTKAPNPFSFLQNIVEGSDEALRAMWQEGEWLEYKGAGFMAHKPDAEKDVRRLWSECLSAFGNTSGGNLIWGVQTKSEGSPMPESVSLAPDARELARRLRELQNDEVDPPVPGVEVREILQVDGSSAGFVICHVPGSAFAPHRALRAEKEYYMRVGDSNRTIPTALLRRMFYPTSEPRLVLRAAAQLAESQDGLVQFQMPVVKVVNRGLASAEDVCIKVLGPFDLYPDESNWQRTNSNVFRCGPVVHRGQEVLFLKNLCERGFREKWPPDWESQTVTFEIFAKNTAATKSEFVFSMDELKQQFKKPISREGISVPLGRNDQL